MTQAENCQKIKLLYLMDMLRTETDEQHPLCTSVLCDRLQAKGVSCDRRTLTRDVRTLNLQGYEVMSCMVGHEKGYYVEDRTFSLPELRILIDMVDSAAFLSKRKSDALAGKLAALGGGRREELLRGDRRRRSAVKHNNDGVLYHVLMLDEAIAQGLKVSFLYFDLDEKAQRVYRHDKQPVSVIPLRTVSNGDRYYLTCVSDARPGLSSYRIDRMENVEQTDEVTDRSALPSNEELETFHRSAFKMFGGPRTECTLQFHDRLIGPIFDRFGEATAISRTENGLCEATVEICLSPAFWGWLFQYAGEMRISQPEGLARQYAQRCQGVFEEHSEWE